MKLTEKLTIRNTTFKNRVMFPPLTTGYEDRNGTITDQDMDFYTRLAKGGVGYIVIGDVAPVNNFTPTTENHTVGENQKLYSVIRYVYYTARRESCQ